MTESIVFVFRFGRRFKIHVRQTVVHSATFDQSRFKVPLFEESNRMEVVHQDHFEIFGFVRFHIGIYEQRKCIVAKLFAVIFCEAVGLHEPFRTFRPFALLKRCISPIENIQQLMFFLLFGFSRRFKLVFGKRKLLVLNQLNILLLPNMIRSTSMERKKEKQTCNPE